MTIVSEEVVVELRANDAKMAADLRGATRLFETEADRMKRASDELGRRLVKSNAAVSSGLKGLALTVATSFSVAQLTDYADGFTRIQNSLKVAGLEGQTLAGVQAKLLDLSSQYGVSLASLSDLFGNTTQAGKELGASQGQILSLTESVSQALLITGKSSQEASGAILGLTQALNKGKLQAEEFQQINEGGLRPLLIAAAASERFGGSIAELQKAAYDGKVTSAEFFRAILDGSAVLSGQASKASLTLAGAYEALNSRLTVYFGEADKANGVSLAMAQAIGALADNLDTIIPVVAALSVAMGVRYVGGLVGAKLATDAATLSTVALRGALVSLQTVGIAVVVGAIGGVIARTNELDAVMGGLEGTVKDADRALEQAGVNAGGASKNVNDVGAKAASAEVKVRNFAGAVGLAAQKLYDLARARQADLIADLETRRQKASLDYSNLFAQTSEGREQRHQAVGLLPTSFRDLKNLGSVLTDDIASLFGPDDKELRAQMDAIKVQLSRYDEAIKGASTNLEQFAKDGGNTPAAAGDSKKKKKKAGKKAEDVEAEQARDLSRLAIEELQARLDLATTAEARADLQREILAAEKQARIDEVKSNKQLSPAQKNAQIKALRKLYGAEPSATGDITVQPGLLQRKINQDEQAEIDRRRLQQADAAAQYEQDALRDEARIASTRGESLAINLRILESLQQQERDHLEAQIAAGEIADADKARAALARAQAAQRTATTQDHESPLEQRRRRVREDAANISDRIENIEVDAIDRLADGVANTTAEYVKLGGVAGDVINGLIRDLIRLATQQALFGGGGASAIMGPLPRAPLSSSNSFVSARSLGVRV